MSTDHPVLRQRKSMFVFVNWTKWTLATQHLKNHLCLLDERVKLEKFAAYNFQGRYEVERKKFMLHKVSYPKESIKSKEVEYGGSAVT